jgi:hypothetical protein
MKSGLFIIGTVIVIVLSIVLIGCSDNSSKGDNLRSEINRFLSYDDGTVLDTSTGLMWAARDNGASTTWQEAKEYCEKYNAGGYTDWRLPTVTELKSLYDGKEPGYRPECAVYDWKVYLTDKIRLTGASPWAAGDHGAEAECFMFDYGCRSRMFKSLSFIMRALPVRDVQ